MSAAVSTIALDIPANAVSVTPAVSKASACGTVSVTPETVAVTPVTPIAARPAIWLGDRAATAEAVSWTVRAAPAGTAIVQPRASSASAWARLSVTLPLAARPVKPRPARPAI